MKGPVWAIIAFVLSNLLTQYLSRDEPDVTVLVYAVEMDGNLLGCSEKFLEWEGDYANLEHQVQETLRTLGQQLEDRRRTAFSQDSVENFVRPTQANYQETVQLQALNQCIGLGAQIWVDPRTGELLKQESLEVD